MKEHDWDPGQSQETLPGDSGPMLSCRSSLDNCSVSTQTMGKNTPQGKKSIWKLLFWQIMDLKWLFTHSYIYSLN